MTTKNSLVVKLWFTIIVIVTAVLIILSISLTFYFKNYALNNSEESLLKDLTRIEQEILIRHEDFLESTNVQTEENLILYQGGQFISGNTETDRAVFQHILNENVGNETFFVKDKNEKEYMVKVLNMSGYFDEETALIKYTDMSPIYKSIRDITMIISISAFIIFIVTTLFAFFLIRKITDPLIELRNSALKMASGEFTSLKVKSFDEIGELTLAFNKMSRDIKMNIHDLEYEKNLRESIFTSISDGIVFFDVTNKPIYMNRQGRNWLNEIHTDRELEHKIYDKIELINTSHESSSIIREVNDSYIEIFYTPVVYSKDVTGVTLTIRDVTNDKKLEDMRSQFISSVSHELKTPMVMLTGYSEALLDEVVTDPKEIKNMIAIIKDESNRMNTLINELIEVNKLEFSSDNFNIKENDLTNLMNDLQNRFNFELKENNLEFKINNNLKSSRVMFDYDKMYQVFTNLIDNAIRYTLSGDSIIISLTENHDIITISVKDTGIGMKASTLNRIFERFYKEDKARTRGKYGTGLGLSIVKNIITRHGGSIDVDSEYEKGTTFYITLNRRGKQ